MSRCKYYDEDYDGSVICHYRDNCENGNPPSGWIDVRDELPEYNERYLVINSSGNRKIMEFRLRVKEFVDERGSGIPDLNVTHWMPLPDKPDAVHQNKEGR